VVAIIAVSAAIAIPAVQAGRRQREVRQTLQHFVAAVREASSKAVLRRRTVELWIRKDANAYELALPIAETQTVASNEEVAEPPADKSDLDELERSEQRRIIGRVSLPASASFGDILGGRALSDDVIAFPFSPTGGSSGGQIEFVFDGGGSKISYTIAFDPLISAIELKQEGS